MTQTDLFSPALAAALSTPKPAESIPPSAQPNDVALYLKAKQAYYFGTPIMSDAQFDALEDRIRKENPDEPALQLVGGTLPEGSLQTKATHKIPMGSQEKVNSFEELVAWDANRKKTLGTSPKLHASYKADGNSFGTYYENGRLVQAISRGEDGTVGDDITAIAALLQHVPLQLDKPLTIGIRCEAVLFNSDWKKVEPELSTNPRNVAGGILGRLDGKEAHFVTALAFDAEFTDGSEPPFLTETQKSEFLESLGFKTPKWRGGLSLEEAKAFFDETHILREADQLPHWIDGIVLKYEDLEDQKTLGIGPGRKPKGQIAWKFIPVQGTSKIETVDWQVGSTGAITPVAYITPTKIAGSTVSKASLANADNIKTLGAYLLAPVKVVKGGDIIPQIIEVLKPFDPAADQPITIPTHCPVCSTALTKRQNVKGEDGVVLFCPNEDCEARTQGRIRRFCDSRKIMGIGKAIIASLVENKIVTTVPELFTLTPEAIENISTNPEKKIRLGRKRAEEICAEIAAKATTMSLPEFLGALGIRSLQIQRATLMIEANPELADLERWLDDSLLQKEFATRAGVPNMGIQIHDSLKTAEPTIRAALPFITLTKAEPPPEKKPGGKTFCITGTLPSGKKKKEYAAPLEAAGHLLVDEVNKDTDILVQAGPESSKSKKAKKIGIPIITEEELQTYLAP